MIKCLTSIAIVWAALLPATTWAKKGNEPLYQDPFDMAAGGASLTRASQDGVIFANPALMPWGKKLYRYSGLTPAAWTTSETAALSRGGVNTENTDALVDEFFETQVHGGVASLLSVVLSHWAMSLFAISQFDLQGSRSGSPAGGPSVDLEIAAYGGLAMSVADYATDWFSLGLTTKYITKSEVDISQPITDRESIEELQSNPQDLLDQAGPQSAMGLDLGFLIFAQGHNLDYRLALKIDDVGGTSFGGGQEPFKQVISIGQGVTFHGNVHAIHLSLDYRDIADEYEDKLFRKVFAGAKLMLQQHLGLAVGIHHGIPSYGVRMDLWAIKFGLCRFSKELTNVIGEKRRNVIMASFSMGW